MQWVANLRQDVRVAVRSLLRQPGFLLVCLVTLALGLGANVAVFGVLDAVLLRPLPYPDADRLVEVREERALSRGRDLSPFMTSRTREAWNANPRTVESVAGYTDRSATVFAGVAQDGLRARIAEVTPDLFPLLGAGPLLGRGFTELDQLVERLSGHPGVEGVGLVSTLPLTPGESLVAVHLDGQAPPTRLAEVPWARPQLVSPGYFEAVGQRVVDGRLLTGEDLGNAAAVVANEAFVRAYLAGRLPVGERIYVGAAGPFPIVGVVGDVRHRGLDRDPEPELYFPHAHWPFGERLPSVDVVVRTAHPEAFAPFLAEDVAALQPFALVGDVMTMEARLAATVAPPRFLAAVLGAFAAGALALALVGIYGVLSYSVSRRGREIGLRMALGADAGGIRNLIVRQGATLVGVGVAVGLGGAVAGGRLLESLLFGVTPLDPVTLAVVPLLLVAAALVACYLPARRATRIDPMLALRTE